MHYIKYFRGIAILRTQQILQFIREHHWLMYHQYIQTKHLLWYIYSINTLHYPLHEYLLMEQVTLHHHHMTHHQKVWHLKVILCHATTYPIKYQTYQMIRIQIQVFQILLCKIHLTHKTAVILNKDVIQKIKINARVNCFQWPYQKVCKFKGHKVQIGWLSTTALDLYSYI